MVPFDSAALELAALAAQLRDALERLPAELVDRLRGGDPSSADLTTLVASTRSVREQRARVRQEMTSPDDGQHGSGPH